MNDMGNYEYLSNKVIISIEEYDYLRECKNAVENNLYKDEKCFMKRFGSEFYYIRTNDEALKKVININKELNSEIYRVTKENRSLNEKLNKPKSWIQKLLKL